MTRPNPAALSALGWSDTFQNQLGPDDAPPIFAARVFGVHRDRISASGEDGSILLLLPPGLTSGEVAVGDWVLANPQTGRVTRVLERTSRIFRRAAGDASREQLIVANVDTVFITTSCSEEFNEARLERYLALAHAGGVPPVFVLTKADRADAPATFVARLAEIAPDVPCILLNSKDTNAVKAALSAWCVPGRTVVFLGMSGVGKSTLAAALTGLDLETGSVREDDMKGRHTTTARELHPIPGGGWLIDTPGMRELRLSDMAEGIDDTFPDIVALAANCRFRDCSHGPEPGCAIQTAIKSGTLNQPRVERWMKLKAEDAENSVSAADRRRKDKAFTRSVTAAKRGKSDRRQE